jgi:sugar lactone lactonase YvrE
MVKILAIDCVWPAGRLLGEGPWWSAEEHAVYWVDIKRPAVLRFMPEDRRCDAWPMPEPIGCCAPRARGGLVAGLRSGIYAIELGAPGSVKSIAPLALPDSHGEGDRFNDGKCHPDGSFWAGTMEDAARDARGWFFRLTPSGMLERVSGPHVICNGPAFSPNGALAYFTDSARRTIYRRDLSCKDGSVEEFARFEAAEGTPDGMTTDTNGRLWIAMWDGSKVLCINAAGERIASVPLPVSRPTSCCFGGEYLDTLFVSSASIDLSPEEHEAQPLAGSLFAVKLDGVTGWGTPAFAG